MEKIKKILFSLILVSFLHSCGGASNAAKVLKNEKITNTDEFLVKKRDPLILPPDYNTLPKPNSRQKSEKDSANNINKILKIPENSTSTQNNPSSVEESIIKSIKE